MKIQYFAVPVFFVLAPILFLYSYNIDITDFSIIVRSLIVFSCVSIAVTFIIARIIRSYEKAAIILSLYWVAFFLYQGFAVPSLRRDDNDIGNISFDQYLWFVTYLEIFILIFFIVVVIRNQNLLRKAWQVISGVGIFLLIVNLFQISVDSQRHVQDKDRERISAIHSARNIELTLPDVPPDIYYIVLDAHGRLDILNDVYHYDSQKFASELTSLGFFIAPKSSTNYSRTIYSLSSSLNFEYLNPLVALSGSDRKNERIFYELIRRSSIADLLKKNGYRFVIFDSGWSATSNTKEADVHMSEALSLNEFENVLLQMTPLSFVGGDRLQHAVHRSRILYALRHTADVAEDPRPTFTFVHIIAPHPPFTFDENGKGIGDDEPFAILDTVWKYRLNRTSQAYIAGYAAQVAYIDSQVLAMARDIIARSKTPPIIIIQGDHGPSATFYHNIVSDEGIHERFPIFNAYFLPGGSDAYEPYDSITPVNTFRLILNKYFGTNLEFLEDRSYQSKLFDPYNFIDVTDRIREG